MSKRTRIVAATLVAVSTLTGALWVRHRADAGTTLSYRLGRVERGDIQSTVSATGTLSAVRTVEVGTQVSGQIAALYVDFNAHVKKGQLIARIDPILQEQAVADARAGLARAEAVVTETRLEFERSRKLHDQQIATDAEFNVAQSNYAQARAGLTSAEINLKRARQNLAYTSIYSPIDGVVVERTMDVGQTVAASFATPKLFVIANDLARMRILASVDESDIGRIEVGQPVTFTVQSFPGRQFTGSVEQVRLNSTTTNNVVSYTAVVSASNADGKLLPGMTASVKFVTASAPHVLTVPAMALRFTPPEGAKTNAPVRRPLPADGRPADVAPLWTVDASGALTPHPVQVGITDGQRTQITSSDLTEGAHVVIGAMQPDEEAASTKTASPLQPQRSGPRVPGGGG